MAAASSFSFKTSGIFLQNRRQHQVFGNIIGGWVIIQRNAQYESGKRDIPLLIDLLISNNFSSMTFFCATRILRVIGRQSIAYNQS